MPLSAAQTTELLKADRAGVEGHLVALNASWAQSEWLPSNNRYRNDCIGRITRDRTPPRRLNGRQMGQYIAASAPTHCMDGWTFLGKALLAHLFGDNDVARHLGYYAELRAAMALLASEGIAVFDREHCVVDNRGRCITVPPMRNPTNPLRPRGPGTHTFVWEALEHWSSQPAAQNLLQSIIIAGGVSMANWLPHFVIAPGMAGILAGDWLKKWGLDIKRLTDDRASRNLVSYRPSAFTSPRPGPARQALMFARHLWKLCEPTGQMRFRLLDRHLLRTGLDFTFKAAHLHGRTRKQASRTYQTRIESLVQQVNPADLLPEAWRRFLSYQDEPDTLQILEEASGKAEPSEIEHVRQVLSRATLLLRVSTGSCGALLRSMPGFNGRLLSFWWTRIGIDHAISDDLNQNSQMIDLWADVGDAVDVLDDWIAGLPADRPSYREGWRDRSASAAVLGTCERIGLWEWAYEIYGV